MATKKRSPRRLPPSQKRRPATQGARTTRPGPAQSQQGLRGVNSVVSLLLELAMIAGFTFWAHVEGTARGIGWQLALIVAGIVIVVWWLLFAPRARFRLAMAPGLALSLGLFLLAAVALLAVGQPILAAVLAVVAIVNRVLAFRLKQW